MRNGFGDHYTDRTLGDRCLMGSNSGPPMRPGSYNNNVHIFQTPGYVAMLNEHIHNVRIIPIDQPHGKIRQWVGDSRGHWEGETLVVETTNLHPRDPTSPARRRTATWSSGSRASIPTR